ncbi:MAG: TIGR03862 family flavoprotein [Rhizobiales bacterium]|nr:TIGR03862 family flavoprotein [Hyphomicrobiales bacterium]
MKASDDHSAPRKTAAVIGGGPAGLMAAEVLARGGAAVTVYDQMTSLGRKFLLAGRGGLNLTHSEDLTLFLTRYGDSDPLLRGAIEAFPPQALRAWSDSLGQPTFVGSSGRVFPTSLKTSPLLRTWLLRLGNLGVTVRLRHRWEGWDADGNLRFVTEGKEQRVLPDITVLALGGASWPRLGSDARWAELLRAQGIVVRPLRPANCGFIAPWSEVLRRFEGQPLKRIALTFAGRSVRGEAMITRDGLEGGAVYALSSPIREAIERDGQATIVIDLLPDVGAAKLAERLSSPRGKQSLSNYLRKATHLSPAALSFVREAALSKGLSLPALNAQDLAGLIKSVPVRLTGVQPIATAISTTGGVSFAELDSRFMLRRRPGVFVAGEMLDWDAPTGGYLLQACFATGVAAARGALAWLPERHAALKTG